MTVIQGTTYWCCPVCGTSVVVRIPVLDALDALFPGPHPSQMHIDFNLMRADQMESAEHLVEEHERIHLWDEFVSAHA